MQLNITARHLDLTPALSDYVHKKVEKAQRYFDSIIWAQTILSVEKHRHIAEVVVHTPGNTFRTKGEAGDLYSAIDLATHKLDLHLSRVKDKKRDNHHKRKPKISKTMLLESEPYDIPVASFSESSLLQPSSFSIAEVKRVFLEARSLSEAVRELNMDGAPFLLFVNERNSRISLIYRKGKKEYGLLEAEEKV